MRKLNRPFLNELRPVCQRGFDRLSLQNQSFRPSFSSSPNVLGQQMLVEILKEEVKDLERGCPHRS